ncbi:hypothetical protein CEUSTIGMA_g8461.t1 [Chlamydomonas eustigma]|uniref:Guanylate cyclase domain-containing protein n=1 Tax=Chlamydomonas eustigma TaxID=1157962 RepID=A0A250XD91_9CHLO|nr:hypothetical protein CEUSTIGMA_g8461.t1 [Chlamydomonas eustigma]|eukprot:GAX81026.1 hypothetical protein CEUSTIGMA_g8461.t1 [Chlamydomonas eustigma]
MSFNSLVMMFSTFEVMNFLNELYQTFDDLVDDYGMYKLDIVGDCYIVVAGLIKEDQDGFVCVDELNENEVASNAQRIMEFAKAMLRESRPVLMPHNNQPVSLRIGIHTGPLVSGLVGSKMPKFTLFGDTMNTASRMETTCRPGCVHVSETFARLIPHEQWESRGSIEVKGKGLMDTCLWVPRLDVNQESGELLDRSLRHANSGASYTSTKSRITSFNAGASDQSSNPLMAILSNIRMDTSGFDDAASTISTSMRSASNRRQLSSGVSLAKKDSRHKRSSDGHGSRIMSEHPSIGSRASSNMLTIGAGPRSSTELDEEDTGSRDSRTERTLVGKPRKLGL